MIQVYLDIAGKALAADKIIDIMDSPVTNPEGYDGGLYFTIEHHDGSFDMVEQTDGEIEISMDIEDVNDHGSKNHDVSKNISLEWFRNYIEAKHS